MKMYYLKIPLRFLCKPEELNVAPEKQQAMWNDRVAGLLSDIRGGHIPGWATHSADLDAVTLQDDGEAV